MEDNTKKPEANQDEIRKNLAALDFSKEEIDDLLVKAEASKSEEEIEKGSKKDLEDLEKAYKEIETKEGEVEKAYKTDKEGISGEKEAMMAKMKEKGYKPAVEKAEIDELNKTKIEKKEEIVKSEDQEKKDELIKGLSEKVEELETKANNTEEVDELKKSIGSVTESISEIKKIVTSIANTPNGMKSHQYSQFLEKAEDNELNNDNKKVISLRDKETLTKSLENLADATDDVDKKAFLEKAIMDYNSNPESQLSGQLVSEIQKEIDA